MTSIEFVQLPDGRLVSARHGNVDWRWRSMFVALQRYYSSTAEAEVKADACRILRASLWADRCAARQGGLP